MKKIISSKHGKVSIIVPKKMIISTLLLLSASLLILGSTYVFKSIDESQKGSRNDTSNTGSIDTTPERTKYNEMDDAAARAIAEGDVDAAIGVYQASINETTDSNTKADAYIKTALMLYNYNSIKYRDMIMANAYKAEELLHSARTATFIYDMSNKYGDTITAGKYFVVIKDRTKNDGPAGD